MLTTQTIKSKSPQLSPKKTIFVKAIPKMSVSPEMFQQKFANKPNINFNNLSSQTSLFKKISTSLNRKQSKQEDPLLIYNPPIFGMPTPAGFKKFLDGELDYSQMLQSQITRNKEAENMPKKIQTTRGKTIFVKNQNPEESGQSKLERLHKLIKQKIMNNNMFFQTSSPKRSRLIDLIQEKKPINVSSNVKKLKQMQIHFIPKNVALQEQESLSYQKIKLKNESDDFLKKLEVEKELSHLDKIFQLQNKKKKKNKEYYPEQQILSLKETLLYNYLREKNCIDRNSLFSTQKESSSNSSRKNIISQERKRMPLCQQVFKQSNTEMDSASIDLSLQSVYEYFLDDIYTEQKKLEQKLHIQQTFNADLDRQLKTINKMKYINSKAIDCSLNKLFDLS